MDATRGANASPAPRYSPCRSPHLDLELCDRHLPKAVRAPQDAYLMGLFLSQRQVSALQHYHHHYWTPKLMDPAEAQLLATEGMLYHKTVVRTPWVYSPCSVPRHASSNTWWKARSEALERRYTAQIAPMPVFRRVNAFWVHPLELSISPNFPLPLVVSYAPMIRIPSPLPSSAALKA